MERLEASEKLDANTKLSNFKNQLINSIDINVVLNTTKKNKKFGQN